MLKLCLVRHGETTSTRRRAFGADEPLLPAGRVAAAGLGAALPDGERAVRTSPARRCLQTAAAAGLDAEVDPALAAVDIGAWRGRTFADVHDADPAAVADWLADPGAAPHGGESLAALIARAAAWLGGLGEAPDVSLVAITHSEVVRALVVHVLGAPPQAFWQLEVEPLSVTELHRHDGRWTLHRLNRPLAA